VSFEIDRSGNPLPYPTFLVNEKAFINKRALMKPALSTTEATRMQALWEYKILDTVVEPAFDDLTRLAAQICRVPISLISFVDSERIWFKSALGLNVNETSRDEGFCGHAILQTDLCIVPDTLKDERFATNPLVVSAPYGRFYAGMPLVTAEGQVLGTLCVVDTIPRNLSQDQKGALRALARQVMAQLELSRSRANLAKVGEQLDREIIAHQRGREAHRDSEARFKQAQEKANYSADHDALTGLPNQTRFKERLQEALSLSLRSEQTLAVLFVNLDRFKTINDTLGYAAGDRLLQEVGQRLIECVPESDTVARFGSDEFALLLTQIDRAEDAAKIAEKICEALRLPFSFKGQELFITISIGISLYPHDGQDTSTLLKSAGAALCLAREQDGNHYQFYLAGRTTWALKQLVLENNLRPALEREEFVVHYQPQVNVDSGQLVGMEALVRWVHPGLGLLYPADFIAIAEETGLIVPIGEWVLRTACMQNKCWQDAGFAPLRMAVNLSPRHFQQANLVETIAQILKDTQLDPGHLELELIEGSIMKDPERAITKLHELKRMGVKIAIDDFGTGYSSLSYLKRFPIDTLKIDQSFIREVTTDSDNAAIVRAIITLASAMKLNVIAEGVETSEELEFLRLLNCDEVQGFLFSKALSVEEFTQLLVERRRVGSRSDYSTTRLPSLTSALRQA
jgi:diguanylate cyclase (GGDEF)-like protein